MRKPHATARSIARTPRTPAADAAAGPSLTSVRTIAVLTTIAAILVRLWFPRAWGEVHAPASVFYEGDARSYLVYALTYILALTPTTIRHWQSISDFNETRASRLPGPLPRFAPVTSYGAFNFANANHEHATGGFNFDAPALRPQTPEEEKQFDEGYLDLALPSVHNVYVHGYAIGLRWIADHPAAALALFGRKAIITSGVFAHGYLQTNVGSSARGTRRPVDLMDPAARWLWPVHIGLVFYGVWLLLRRPERAGGAGDAGRASQLRWVVFCPLASLAVSSILFYGYVRLGAAYLPVFWLLQAPALAAVAARLPWPRAARDQTGLVIFGLALVLLAVEAFGLTIRRGVLLEGTIGPDGRLVQDATVIVKEK